MPAPPVRLVSTPAIGMTDEHRETTARKDAGDSLTERQLERLLDRLGSDREAAAREYERIRSRLVRFLEWRECSEAEDVADEAMNRVARRLAEGVEIESGDPYVYFRGVAGKVMREWVRGRMRERDAHRRAVAESERLCGPAFVGDGTDPHVSDLVRERLGLLWACLDRLPDEDRELVLSFYQGDGPARIRQRRLLARGAGVSMDTLRLRAFRIRRRLERCIEERLAEDD